MPYAADVRPRIAAPDCAVLVPYTPTEYLDLASPYTPAAQSAAVLEVFDAFPCTPRPLEWDERPYTPALPAPPEVAYTPQPPAELASSPAATPTTGVLVEWALIADSAILEVDTVSGVPVVDQFTGGAGIGPLGPVAPGGP